MFRYIATRFHSTNTQPKTAIVLLNMGGPETSAQVEPFLFNLFSDKDLIPLPLQSQLAPWIAKRRTPKIQQQYDEIGGGSPIKHWTKRQGTLLELLLDAQLPESAPHKSYIAFRYAPPMTLETVKQMKEDGITRAIALTLYPQYSCSTTGSSINELYKTVQKLDPEQSITWSVIDRWPTHPGLVKVNEKIKKLFIKLDICKTHQGISCYVFRRRTKGCSPFVLCSFTSNVCCE